MGNETDKRLIGKVLIFIGCLLGFLMVGYIIEHSTGPDYAPSATGPIPDLGVNDTKVTQFELESARIRKQQSRKILNQGNDYLTSEELQQNIEDAEMKGMGDDPATLEDLRDELK